MDDRGLQRLGRFTVFMQLMSRKFFTQIMYFTVIFVPKTFYARLNTYITIKGFDLY
jgi:hypothetical protein